MLFFYFILAAQDLLLHFFLVSFSLLGILELISGTMFMIIIKELFQGQYRKLCDEIKTGGRICVLWERSELQKARLPT